MAVTRDKQRLRKIRIVKSFNSQLNIQENIDMFFRGKNYGNDTIDVFNKNCFSQYNFFACSKTVLLVITASITITFIILKIYRYHAFKHKQIQHYAIFYLTMVEILVCISSFVTSHKYPQIKFAAIFLKLLIFSIICHLHWSSSARTHNKEDIIQHVINPGLCLYMIYCTAVALMGMVDIGTTWNECLKPYWLMLSIADFVAVQCFASAAVYITNKFNCLPALASFKSAQRRDLMTVVIAYEISAVFSVAFDALMRSVGTEETGCSAVYGHSQFFYSITELVFNIGKYLLPTWAILVVFQPVDGSNRTTDISISGGYILDGTPNSNRSSIRGHHQYHRMCVAQTGSQPENPSHSPYTYPFQMENSPSPSNSVSSLSSLTTHSDGLAYVNHVSMNFNTLGEHEKPLSKFQQSGLTTISEESNINMMDAIEKASVRSERSGSSHY